MIRVLLSLLAPITLAICAEPEQKTNSVYNRTVTYAYTDADEFNTIIKAKNVTVEQIKAFNGDNSDPDDPRFINGTDDVALYNIRQYLCDITTKGQFCFQELFLHAQYFKAEAEKARPSLVVGFGRSPFLIVDMLAEIYKQEKPEYQAKLKHMAFSGCPDVLLDIRKDNGSYLNDLLVPRRVATIFKYFDELGFDNSPNGIWFIDILGLGQSKNSFMRLLKEYYAQKNMSLPPIHLFLMHTFASETDFSFLFLSYSFKNKELSYNNKYLNIGIRPLKIPTTLINTSETTLRLVDQDFLALRCAPVQKYRAFMMRQGSE